MSSPSGTCVESEAGDVHRDGDGSIVHPREFLFVSREPEDPCEDSPYDYDADLPSYYDGIASTDSEFDVGFRCSPYDGIAATESKVDISYSPFDGIVATDSGLCYFGSPYDGIVPSNSALDLPYLATQRRSTQQFGVSDMTCLTQRSMLWSVSVPDFSQWRLSNGFPAYRVASCNDLCSSNLCGGRSMRCLWGHGQGP